ncbi:MAG: DNA gyrase inhibitor YacG [Gammaproteobacteria bacterium]|nr:MAG: DNA gyrase inhibitor YacG [Gammaproteobacteria bacterium]RKZ72373.1 MAG: DNA gyrase inhibitor YacG [Gammaproteobacteria bacterium]
MKKSIECPECGKATEYSPKNEYRPFCSHRCKLIDLGEWIEGKYAINSEENSQESQYLEDESSIKH